MSKALIGVPLEEALLSVEELARACSVERTWIVERVTHGLLGGRVDGEQTQWRFASAELVRARCMVSMERDMDANPEVAALMADLIEEVRRLRQRLRSGGMGD